MMARLCADNMGLRGKVAYLQTMITIDTHWVGGRKRRLAQALDLIQRVADQWPEGPSGDLYDQLLDILDKTKGAP